MTADDLEPRGCGPAAVLTIIAACVLFWVVLVLILRAVAP